MNNTVSYNIFPVWVCRENGVVIPCFKVIKRSNFSSDSAIRPSGRTPNDEISESKKLLVLLSKRFLSSGVILGSVINRPKNKSFLWLLQIQLNSNLKVSVAKDQVQTREHRKYV